MVAINSSIADTDFSIDSPKTGMDPVKTTPMREGAPPPIAILGMAMRLPGGVRSAEDFWQMLSNGEDGRCVVPESRYNEGGFYSESGAHSVGTRHGYFLQEDLETLDTSFFDMDGLQPPRMDPQQKLLLQVVWDCLENGGQMEWRGKDVGCFVGTFGGDWGEIETKDTQNAHNFHLIGRGSFALANVVSYEFDFKGPSMTVETGCSSSLVALNQACQALQMGDCSTAIVAGTNLIFSPTIGLHAAGLSVFSPSGISRTFDASADGYGRGEAVNAILIKRLDDAMRDGDPVRAVIRSTMVNCDGRSPGITTPSADAQERLIRAAYTKAFINDISHTAFVECHGTGTLAGDPIECAAIAKVFPEGVYIGSVKPNVGHSEGASGLTSLIKAVLCLENRRIPPNIHFNRPNPRIAWEDCHLRVPEKLITWPKNRKERISVSNFGIGGSNAHVVLDSFQPSSPAQKNSCKESREILFVISANSERALLRREESLLKYMALHPNRLADMAYTLGVHRKHLSHRGFLIKPATADVNVTGAKNSIIVSPPAVAFVFTGQGAQWAGMGQNLLTRFQSFRDDIRFLDDILQQLERPPCWNLEDALVDPDVDLINNPELSQTLCGALQIALVNLLARWGVSPASVIGHSSGEIGAAYAAGAITVQCAITLSYYRGWLVEELGQPGAMAAVGLSRGQVASYLQGTVGIACENSPTSVTLSGKQHQLESVLHTIKTDHPETDCRMLRVNRAYHSEHMASVAKAYESRIRPYMALQKTMVPMYSSLTADRVLEPQQLNARYWGQNLESPVLFWGASESILQEARGGTFFLEIGPHSALAGPLRDIFKASNGAGQELSYASCLIRGQNQISTLLKAAGELFVAGVPIDFAAVNGPGNVLTDLDPYPWECGKVNWRETRITREWRFRKHPHHELLGSRVVESTPLEPVWRNMLHIDDISWLWDHRIGGSTVFPCAGYIVMAGEAIRQITGNKKYRVRNLHMNKALTIDDHEKAEIVSSFQPVRYAGDDLPNAWYQFSITSFRRGSWAKHCTGQVRGEASSPPSRDIRGLPREVEAQPWYDTLKDCGLEYGPRFKQLQHISAHPIQLSATASLEIDGNGEAVDPPTIDQCLQLVLVAMCNGISRKCGAVGMPVFVQEAFVGETGQTLFLEATAAGTSLGMTAGSATAQFGAKVAVKIEGLEFKGLDEGSSEDREPKLCSQLVWEPDVGISQGYHLLSAHDPVIPSLNETFMLKTQFFDMCIIETARRIASLEPASWHLRKYQNWVNAKSAAILDSYGQAIHSKIGHVLGAPRQDWPDILIGLQSQIKATMPLTISFTELSLAVLENCVSIVTGNCSPLPVLMENDGLTRLYNTGSHRVYEKFLKLLGHDRADLNIIELGAGTGATTARTLQCLHPSGGNRQYSRYLFTDISPSFFQSAKERFKNHSAIEFAVLDISQPPKKQGIEAGSFDLVIASNVFHATPSIQETLRNAKSLLKPGGRVLIEEICSEALPIEYIMGVLPGWWMGDGDNRVDVPYISVEQWNEELGRAGFVGVQAAADEEEIYMTSIIASIAPSGYTEESTVNILCHSERHPWVTKFAKRLKGAGSSIRWCAIAEPPPANEDVISLLDVEEPFLYSMSKERYSQIQQYLSSCTSTRLLWVTHGLQMLCQNPRYGLILGFARTMRAEYQMDFATVEVDEFDHRAEDALIGVYQKFQQQRFQGEETVDYEYAIRDGVVHNARYRWSHLSQNLLEDARPDSPKALVIEQPGILESLSWVEKKPLPLGDNEVEIAVRCVGLNFRDLMVGLGMLPAKDELGLEGSGVVRKVGSDVARLHPGDRVIFLATPAFSTRVVVPESLAIVIPAGLSLEQAATVGCAYTTAAYCLLNVGKLHQGQSVLIHSAAGGVGIASIILCQMVGAQVFVSVGNQDKAQFLTQKFGIRPEHIFDSRSVSFAPNLLKRTGGRGVDIVLNSLAGDLLLASWNCVAEGGMMVEIGKRDLMGHGMLPMDRFLANRSFVGVDILSLARSQPTVMQECLDRVSALFAHKPITPIQPMHTFEADQVAQAFKYMQEGKHMGKVIVQMPEEIARLSTSKAIVPISFHSDGAYLLVGGLGGLGRAVAQWMVENGAKFLVFLSRSANTSASDGQLIHDLALQGCHALLVRGDVTNWVDTQRAVAASCKPIKGVLHLAMVMQDSPFFRMTYDKWTSALQPKVEGAWNLHRALQSSSLDFFIMFSSVAAAAGSAGQANYTAANTFLDAFARYRRSLGLPASVLDVGWLVDIGYVSKRPELTETMRSKGYLPLREKHLLAALQLLLRPPCMVDGRLSPFNGLSHLSLGLGLSGARITSQARYKDARYRHDPAVGFAHSDTSSSGNSGNSNVKALLRAVEADPDVLKLAPTVDLLTKEMALLMGPFTAAVKGTDLAAMSQIAVDSLVAVEARTWLQRNLGVELGLVDVATAGTVQGVVSLAMNALSSKHLSKS